MKKDKLGKIIAIIISIIVTIILIVIFCNVFQMLLDDISISSNIIIFLLSLMIISVPIIVSIKILFMLLKGKIKVLTNVISELVLVPVSIIYLFIAIIVIAFVGSLFPVKNYHQYEKIYNTDSEIVKYFPSVIPKDAYDIKFYYEPSVLQKGRVMNLYFKVDDFTINNYKSKYEKLELDSNKINKEYISEDLHLDNEIKLNNNYKKYFLYFECDDSGYCNHGAYSFVAINDNNNECIFVLSEW